MTYGLGHIPDPESAVADDLDHRHIGRLIGAAPVALPASVDYSSLVGPIPDQGTTSSCVGNALSTACLVRSDIAGHRLVRPSRKAIYDLARLVDSPRDAMKDKGSMPRAAIVGMTDYGLVAEERWPLVDINTPPPLDVFSHALDAMVTGHYRIGSGPGCAALIRQALAKGFTPCLALQVDAAFMDYGGGVYQGGGKSLGGHYLCAVGYGDGFVRVCNSWSSSWGEGGFIRMADSVLDSSAVSDVIVVTIVPLDVA